MPLSHDVVIVGAGPTGLTLAAELKLAGVDVALVERRTYQSVAGSRAGGLHARTLEVFDQRGIAGRFLAQGQTVPVVGFNLAALAIDDLPTRHPYTLALWQHRIERVLAEWVDELGVPVRRGIDADGFAQDDAGVELALADGRCLRACYLVGCDGARSRIRKAAGIGFPGWDATTSWLIAEADTAEEPQWGLHEDAHGVHAIGRTEDGRARIVLTERRLAPGGDPTLEDVRGALAGIYGTDFGIHSPTWVSRFTDMARQAAEYRRGRVLLAGDAAHVHPPLGGQGLNLGVQDAVNLGWKLAQVVAGLTSGALLDTYHAERHPVAARVLRNTMAQVALRRTDTRSRALRGMFAELLQVDEARRRLAAEMSGLDVRYDLGAGHPLLGRRMPDLDFDTTHGPLRTYALLHGARPLLLDFDVPGGSTSRRPGRIGSGTCARAARAPGTCRRTAPSPPPPPCWCGRTATSPGSATAAMPDSPTPSPPGSARPRARPGLSVKPAPDRPSRHAALRTPPPRASWL